MQVMINVPDKIYEMVMNTGTYGCYRFNSTKAIREGVPLDKVRAEIETQEKWLVQVGYNAYNVDIAFSSIKSVLAGSED